MKPMGLRQSFAKDGKRRKAAMHLIPNLFTTGNLLCGVFAILSVFNADYMVAAVAILVAMIFDVLDGKSARMTNSTSHFGFEYDSLSDVVSFGVAPGLLIYSWALSGQGTFGMAVMFAYVAMGAVRLARFNSTATVPDGKYFTGLGHSCSGGGCGVDGDFRPLHCQDWSGSEADPGPDHYADPFVLDGEHHQVSQF